MREVLQWSGEAGSEVERAALANRLQQRWLEALNSPGGIPDVTHPVSVYGFNLRTGEASVQRVEFHGPLLATTAAVGDEVWGLIRRRVILGTNGQLIEIATAVFEPDQRSWWNYTTVDKLAEDPGLARAVLAGFDSLRKGVIAPLPREPAHPLSPGILAFPAPDGDDPYGGFSA